MKRTLAGLFLFALLIGVFVSAYKIQLANAQTTTIYINADGSITPSSAPISTVGNVTYTFTGNVSSPVYNGVVVERSNIILDGNGYTVQGYDYSGNGLSLTDISNVTIENVNIQGFEYGIFLNESSNNLINWNNATGNFESANSTANGDGIVLFSSNNNIVSDNTATANGAGIDLYSSLNNTISWNNVTANSDGMYIESSSNYNTVIGNNATANLYAGINVQTSSNNNTFSGNDATANYVGFYLSASNNTVSGNNVTANVEWGCCCLGSSDIVSGNNVTANNVGIYLIFSANKNTISDNSATANSYGIWLDSSSSNNTLIGNNVTANVEDGIKLYSSSNNIIYHNNFIGNTNQTSVDSTSVGNVWDNGYPSGGNFWSDYNGTDLFSGPYQNVTGSDGIGETPYVIDENNTDNYPLMGVFSDFNVAQGVDVQTVSNSTVSDFQFNGTALLFNVTGENGTTGFCRVGLPTALLNGTLTVFVNGTERFYRLLPGSNSTESYLYFTYSHSTEQIIITANPFGIVPEFPTSILLPFLMMATLIAIVFYKKKTILCRSSGQAEK